MSLEDALANAGERLASGALPSEAQVQASVIRPVLRALGWDDADPAQWRVEYQVDHGRVDEALLDPAGTPLVFVEAKKQGNLSIKAEDQLFGYAAHNGVPTLVLTDGDTWDLYLSMAAGKPADRRFAHLVISETRSLEGMADDLRQFLGRETVLSGAADDAAKARLKQVKDRELGKGGLEAAWTELLTEPDEMLRDLLIERVEQDSGSRPWAKDAEEFIRRQRSAKPTASPRAFSGSLDAWLAAVPEALGAEHADQIRSWLAEAAAPDASTSPSESQKLRGFVIEGTEHRADSNVAAIRKLVSVLQDRDRSFLMQWSSFDSGGRIKRPRAVQDGHPILGTKIKGRYTRLDEHPGWWLYTHGSVDTSIRRMRNMSQLAGLVWESDISPILE